MTWHVSNSPEETESIAGNFARGLSSGGCVALEGELGAGKTQFVRGVVRALGGNGRAVSSPTFVLLHVYPTSSLTVYHLDAYRVTGAEDFAGIGFSELLEQGGVVMVEWAARVANLLPEGTVHVRLEHLGEGRRGIEIGEARGSLK